jgi:hypothetical protein
VELSHRLHEVQLVGEEQRVRARFEARERFRRRFDGLDFDVGIHEPLHEALAHLERPQCKQCHRNGRVPSQHVREHRPVFVPQRTIENRLTLDEICGRAARIRIDLALAAIGEVLAHFLALIEHRGDDTREPVEIRFRQESCRTTLPRDVRRGRIGISGNEDERRAGALRLCDGERRQAIEARDVGVGQDDVGRVLERLAERDLALHALQRAGDTGLLERPAGRLGRRRIVLENQHANHFNPFAART